MTSVTAFVEDCPTTLLTNLTLSHQEKMKSVEEERENGDEGEMNAAVVVNDGVCAICLDCIELQETALVKGCEHAYCVNCILQWATYHEHPKCPQCKHPFESLSVHRALDGTLRDYMLEESVCLLVRASWFKPLVIEHHDDPYDDDFEDLYFYQYGHRYDEEEEDDLHEAYFGNSSSSTLRIGNRRWGDNGYVRAGRQEARPVQRSNPNPNSGSSSSRQRKKKQQVEWEDPDAESSHGPGPTKEGGVGKELMGRRAKRAMKREAADKAAAAKHQQHLIRLGRQ